MTPRMSASSPPRHCLKTSASICTGRWWHCFLPPAASSRLRLKPAHAPIDRFGELIGRVHAIADEKIPVVAIEHEAFGQQGKRLRSRPNLDPAQFLFEEESLK